MSCAANTRLGAGRGNVSRLLTRRSRAAPAPGVNALIDNMHADKKIRACGLNGRNSRGFLHVRSVCMCDADVAMLIMRRPSAFDRHKIGICLTDRPIAGHGRSRENRPVPVTSRSIGASLMSR